jgi:hypothetical protein
MGGVPLIDDGVNFSGIATLACEVRRRLGGDSGGDLREFLDPFRAYTCYQLAYPQLGLIRPSEELTAEQEAAVQAACREILAVVPEWRLAFAIPLRWRRVKEDIASSTNPRVPQTIFFGERAFLNPILLQEHIVHEVSHTWLGMIGEVSPLTRPSLANYVLPSGTKNKEYWNLLFALSFAVSAIRFYKARQRFWGSNDTDSARMQYLHKYSQGCIAQVDAEPEKQCPSGREILMSCRRYLDNDAPVVTGADANQKALT